MIRTIAVALLLLAAMPTGSTALAQDEGSSATGANNNQQSAAPAAPLWMMSCSNQIQPEQLLCEFSQSIVLTQGNQSQRVATASFNRVAGQSQTNAVFTFPYGVSLPDPVTIHVDDKEVGSLVWQSCDAGGCYANAPVDEAWLQAMRDGQELVARLHGRDGRELSFSFQLNGFTKAEQMLP